MLHVRMRLVFWRLIPIMFGANCAAVSFFEKPGSPSHGCRLLLSTLLSEAVWLSRDVFSKSGHSYTRTKKTRGFLWPLRRTRVKTQSGLNRYVFLPSYYNPLLAPVMWAPALKNNEDNDMMSLKQFQLWTTRIHLKARNRNATNVRTCALSHEI